MTNTRQSEKKEKTKKNKSFLFSISNTWRRLSKISGIYASKLRNSVLLLVTAAVLQGISLACIVPLFMALIDKRNNLIALTWLIILTLSFVLSAALRWRANYFDYHGDMIQITQILRTHLGEKLRLIPLQSIQKQHSGMTISTLISSVDNTFMFLLSAFNLIISAIFIPITIAIFMLFYEWKLSILLTLVFPLLLPFYYWLRPKFKQSSKEIETAHLKLSADIIEYLQGLNILRTIGNQKKPEEFLHNSLKSLQKIQSENINKNTNPSMMMATVIELVVLVIIVFESTLVFSGQLPLSILMGILVIIIRLGVPLSNIVAYAAFIETIETAIDSLESILQEKELPIFHPAQSPDRYDISFENVSFQYDNSKYFALSHINLKFPAKKLTAIVGESGCGKSTLTKLIQRFADPQAGIIKIGGIDIRYISKNNLINLISVVFQDVYLFNGTIIDNIGMSNNNATQEDIKKAARLAYCDEFIQRLPAGYHTKINDIGGSLSGGERQRISIARAILKNSPIIILDEPTSSLDSESGYWVQKAIDTLLIDKTVIMISHRLSTVTCAEKIIVMNNGMIIEQGTHQELIKQQSKYWHYYKLANALT